MDDVLKDDALTDDVRKNDIVKNDDPKRRRGPKPKDGATRTPAQRQAAYRARRKAGLPTMIVKLRDRPDRRSRPARWRDAVAVLVALQEEYQEWHDNLPEEGGSEVVREKLEAIVELDLSDLEAVEPPLGFGRD